MISLLPDLWSLTEILYRYGDSGDHNLGFCNVIFSRKSSSLSAFNLSDFEFLKTVFPSMSFMSISITTDEFSLYSFFSVPLMRISDFSSDTIGVSTNIPVEA